LMKNQTPHIVGKTIMPINPVLMVCNANLLLVMIELFCLF